METSKVKEKHLFQFVPLHKGHGILDVTLAQGRILVGRTESCEFVIPSEVVSAVHAIIEITPSTAKIYDMNSKNGTYVNDKKVVVSELKIGDKVSFGNIHFIFRKYETVPELPPVLDILEPIKGIASPLNTNTALPSLPPEIPKPIAKSNGPEVPYIIYPLAADEKSDYSEYIFEDVEELYPIFKYEHGKQAVEVIILFNDKVYSVDYLDEKDGTYYIVGANPSKRDLEFAYLGKSDKLPFVEMKSGNCVVNALPGYQVQHLTNNAINKASDGRVNIQNDDILRLENGHLQLFVRRVGAPPKIKPAPFFRRDQGLRKYLLLMLLLTFLPLVALNFFEVDKELDKEKDPERIARILYKQPLTVSKNKAVEKTEKAPPVKQTTTTVKQESPKKEQKVEPKKEPVKKVVETKPDPGVKSAPKVQEVKKVEKPLPKKAPTPAPTKAAAAATPTKVQTAQAQKAAIPSPNQGAVDVFKNFNFKSTVSSNMAKGGTLQGASTAAATTSEIGSASIGGGVASNLKKADVGSEVGSLTGSTVGKLAESKGAEGLSAKTGIYTAGIPAETVVLGSMDPDVIRRILREHIPQFRYCYQKELDRNAGKDISGTIGLNFTIGASGHVSNAGVTQSSNLPADVRGCVVRVLRGIKFPSPLGGGTVDVKQPFNFMPQRL